ncbi:hypothetical protein [Rhodococcus sp. NPDC058514]|uniref:hypothetical protein n=1 Tax=unclassified Rhodococcus (in: high G+C Gram-positive bacteria) TaxID=192944 RepID=UPI003652EB94
MSLSSTPTRRIAARVATAAAAAALLAAGVTGTATAQSADAVGSAAAPGHDASATHATTTHDNLAVTHEAIGPNIGFAGDEIHYRTTISATNGPARQVTAIQQVNETADPCGIRKWQIPVSGTVTYTNPTGERVTDSTNLYGGAAGSWTVDPTAGSTVVYDTVYALQNPNLGPAVGCGRTTDPVTRSDAGAAGVNLDALLLVSADSLNTLTWSPTGVTVSCALGCRLGSPAGSAELFFGS